VSNTGGHAPPPSEPPREDGEDEDELSPAGSDFDDEDEGPSPRVRRLGPLGQLLAALAATLLAIALFVAAAGLAARILR
jgi:hypothetical protein